MTREEAILEFETMLAKYAFEADEAQAIGKAFEALRPVSREQVEKVWVGCGYCEKHKINLVRIEMNYNDSPGGPERLNPTRAPKFCPICGSPLTGEAVQMVMERMEALYEAT